MKVEFHIPEDVETVVATATWNGTQASIESGDDAVAAKLWKVFRATAVVVDDAAYRRQGTSGEVALQPGSLQWFRAAAQVRAAEAGLVARLVPGVTEGGFDPAADHGTLEGSIERLVDTGEA